MKMKNSMYLIGLGIGATILYQQIKNGNLRKIVIWIHIMNKIRSKNK